jgi:hypothetical protein
MPDVCVDATILRVTNLILASQERISLVTWIQSTNSRSALGIVDER